MQACPWKTLCASAFARTSPASRPKAPAQPWLSPGHLSGHCVASVVLLYNCSSLQGYWKLDPAHPCICWHPAKGQTNVPAFLYGKCPLNSSSTFVGLEFHSEPSDRQSIWDGLWGTVCRRAHCVCYPHSGAGTQAQPHWQDGLSFYY